MTTPKHRLHATHAFALMAYLSLAGPAMAQLLAEGQAACRKAGIAAERAQDLPPGLLLAIGQVESGRRDPATGAVSAWPWTLNAAGTGQAFRTSDEAQAATRLLQGGGIASIDVGCFQVNLMYHPSAFASLDEAFDPQANARYAGRYLSELRARLGTWDAAIAAYHSATPERGGPYRDRVMAGWTGGPPLVGLPGAFAGPPRPLVDRLLAWSPPAPGAAMRIWSPSQPGMAPAIITLQQGHAAIHVVSPR